MAENEGLQQVLTPAPEDTSARSDGVYSPQLPTLSPSTNSPSIQQPTREEEKTLELYMWKHIPGVFEEHVRLQTEIARKVMAKEERMNAEATSEIGSECGEGDILVEGVEGGGNDEGVDSRKGGVFEDGEVGEEGSNEVEVSKHAEVGDSLEVVVTRQIGDVQAVEMDATNFSNAMQTKDANIGTAAQLDDTENMKDSNASDSRHRVDENDKMEIEGTHDTAEIVQLEGVGKAPFEVKKASVSFENNVEDVEMEVEDAGITINYQDGQGGQDQIIDEGFDFSDSEDEDSEMETDSETGSEETDSDDGSEMEDEDDTNNSMSPHARQQLDELHQRVTEDAYRRSHFVDEMSNEQGSDSPQYESAEDMHKKRATISSSVPITFPQPKRQLYPIANPDFAKGIKPLPYPIQLPATAEKYDPMIHPHPPTTYDPPPNFRFGVYEHPDQPLYGGFNVTIPPYTNVYYTSKQGRFPPPPPPDRSKDAEYARNPYPHACGPMQLSESGWEYGITTGTERELIERKRRANAFEENGVRWKVVHDSPGGVAGNRVQMLAKVRGKENAEGGVYPPVQAERYWLEW